MKYPFINLSIIVFLTFSCTPQTSSESAKAPSIEPENKGHELIIQLTEKMGTYSDLLAKQDVIYRYTYTTPDGKTDISTEKYIFDGELSLGIYHKHERTLHQLTDTIVQGYNGHEFWLAHNGGFLQDEQLIQRVRFNRKTNFYWFAMFQKLLDPGLLYEYLGERQIGDAVYDLVKVSFETTSNQPTDIYQLYINRGTGLVDQFLFTVVDYGVVEAPFLMKIEYEEIDGFLIPSKRKYKKST